MYSIPVMINNKLVSVEIEENKTIRDLKTKVKNHELWGGKHVKFHVQCDVPIRMIGKQSFFSGEIQSLYDDYQLREFPFETKKSYSIIASETKEEPIKQRVSNKTKITSKKIYVPPSQRSSVTSTDVKEFQLNEEEFPKLV